MNDEIKVSVVFPCLNEEKSIGICVNKAKKALNALDVSHEILVTDNGSTDNSAKVALDAGATVIKEPKKGYGNAYLAGIKASRGKFVVMADADDTYDLSDIADFIRPLDEGYELVMGSRFKGELMPGAMSWSHRYIGNPILSTMLKIFFNTRISDSHCGYRSFTRTAFDKMRLKTSGMEFASEMVVNAIKEKIHITEIPIKYHPRIGDSKLESLKDAWRHIRFMLLYAPTYLYLLPGIILLAIGLLLLLGLSFGPVKVFGRFLDFHFNILGTVLSLLGFQILSLGVFARSFSFLNGFDRFDKKMKRFIENFHLEKGIILGSIFSVLGCTIFFQILLKWIQLDYGKLFEIRRALLATTLTVIGIQIIFSSFFLGFLILEKKQDIQQ